MKRTIKKLAYIHLYSNNVQETANFFRDMFEWEVFEGDQGQIYVAMDKYHHRIVIYHRDTPGLKAVGWQVFNYRDFLETAKILENAGISCQMGTEEQCQERKVSAFLSFTDPGGNIAEVCYAPFVTRPQVKSIGNINIVDMLHVTVAMSEEKYKKNLAFYEQVLGFNVSDFMNGNIAFTRCSHHHHNLAMAASEEPGREFRHFMFEVESVDDLMRTYYRAKEKNCNIHGPGRHGNCQTLHVYMQIPGVGLTTIEIGWGQRKIMDDDNWEVVRYEFYGEELKEFIDVYGSFRVHK
jgi:predicted enzyme related to lactoylglutathione lyase